LSELDLNFMGFGVVELELDIVSIDILAVAACSEVLLLEFEDALSCSFSIINLSIWLSREELLAIRVAFFTSNREIDDVTTKSIIDGNN